MSITRVQYRERQRLTAADLRVEQDYRLAMAGRHHVSHHEWGIVRGLRVSRNAVGEFSLTPGVAIDGYGREIFVPEVVLLEVDDPDACETLALYYCEADAQSRPDRGCDDVPAPRIAQRFAWVIHPGVDLRDEQDQVASARAAGRMIGAPTWPVPVARVGKDCLPLPKKGEPDRYATYAAVRYVRHRASVVRSPHGRASLQIGLIGLSDVHHVLLSTREGATMKRRIAIDRDGTVHVWGRLAIAGDHAEARIPVAENKLLIVSLPAVGGILSRPRVEGRIDPDTHTLAVSLIEPQVWRDRSIALEVTKRFDAVKRFAVRVPFGGSREGLFELVNDAGKGIPFSLARRERASEGGAVVPPPQEPFSFAEDAGPTGGRLILFKTDGPTSTAVASSACDDVGRSRQDGRGPGTPVLQLRPAATIKENPLAREIHGVTTSKPTDMVPKTELRISGGAEDETDTSTRLSIGASAGVKGQWLRAVQMDGGRRLEILAIDDAPTKPLLKVSGAMYLPPIGKKDPLLPDLLALAFINGLRQIGKISPQVVLSITNEPAQVERGAELTYTVHAQWSVAIQVKRCVEIVTGTSGNGDMAFRNITTIDLSTPPKNSGEDFSVTFKNFTHAAAKVRIEIRMLVARSNTTTVAVATSKEIVVGP